MGKGRKPITLKEFVSKAKEIYGEVYDYSQSKYINAHVTIDIVCKIHGVFKRTPAYHLRGGSCPKCNGGRIKFTPEEFRDKCFDVHGDRYNYDLVKYEHCEKPVNIVCEKHGIFSQTPISHMIGRGCPKCGYENRLSCGWNHSSWKEAAIKSKNFDSFKLYVIECFNESEQFIKIGKTFNTLDDRFSSNIKMPYNWEVVNIFEGNSKFVSTLESNLHKKFKDEKYKPNLNFDGDGECFYISVKNKI